MDRMKSKIAGLIVLIAAIITVQPLQAQFEGKITYSHFKVDQSSGEERAQSNLDLLLTPERIRIASLDNVGGYTVMQGMKSEGVLIRLDLRDFIFMTGDKTAMKISKEELVSMFNMMKSMAEYSGSGEQPQTPEYRINKTGETQSFKGYTCEKMVISSEESPGERLVAWLTYDEPVNWGMMTESWGEGAQALFPDDLPMQEILDKQALPIRVERHVGGKLIEGMEATNISKERLSRDLIEIPTDVQVMSMQDMMMQNMYDN